MFSLTQPLSLIVIHCSFGGLVCTMLLAGCLKNYLYPGSPPSNFCFFSLNHPLLFRTPRTTQALTYLGTFSAPSTSNDESSYPSRDHTGGVTPHPFECSRADALSTLASRRGYTSGGLWLLARVPAVLQAGVSLLVSSQFESLYKLLEQYSDDDFADRS